MKKKKKIYILFDSSLFLSILVSAIFDIEKLPGVRSTFSTSQLKNSITSSSPDAINSLESSTISIDGYQEPVITNNTLC